MWSKYKLFRVEFELSSPIRSFVLLTDQQKVYIYIYIYIYMGKTVNKSDSMKM